MKLLPEVTESLITINNFLLQDTSVFLKSVKLIFNIFIFLAVFALNAELILSFSGKANMETLSKLNDSDDDEDSDDNSLEEEEEEQQQEQKGKEWFAESPIAAEFQVFQPELTRAFWPSDHFIEFNLIDLPYSPPEFA